MLTRFVIENFRALVSVNVELKPLTVLIGPNDSGKSAFLDAVWNVVHVQGPSAPTDIWKCDTKLDVRYRGTTQSSFSEFSKGQNVNQQLLMSLRPVQRLQLPPQGALLQSSGLPETHGPPPIGTDGA